MKHQQPTEPVQLTVIARSPFHVYYEGVAEVVSATNKVGRFDILPGHADFFSMLSPGDIVIESAPNPSKPSDTSNTSVSAEPVTFTITNGILTVRDDEVMIFVNM